MSDRARFEHASRVMHHGRRCERCTQFYYAGGEVHPIRNSPGYSQEVADISARERHHRARAEFYGHERRESSSGIVERPPWAAGLADRHLMTIARAHGVNAGMPLWWEKAGLVGSVKADPRIGQKAEKGSGELRYALEGRSSFDRRRGQELYQARRRETPRAAGVHVYKGGGDDLPF